MGIGSGILSWSNGDASGNTTGDAGGNTSAKETRGASDEVEPHRRTSRIGPADQVTDEGQARSNVMFREWRAYHYAGINGHRLDYKSPTV